MGIVRLAKENLSDSPCKSMAMSGSMSLIDEEKLRQCFMTYNLPALKLIHENRGPQLIANWFRSITGQFSVFEKPVEPVAAKCGRKDAKLRDEYRTALARHRQRISVEARRFDSLLCIL